jgi:protein-disulfide isomerase
MKKIILTLTMLLSLTALSANAQQISDQQLGQKIHDYMISHPEILQEMIQAEHNKMMVERKSTAKQFLKTIANDNQAPTAGNPNGNITLVEFFDYQCSACKAAWPELKAAIADEKNIKITYAELPFFPGSKYAAEISLAAYKTDPIKYEEFHSNLMQRKEAEGKLTPEEILNVSLQAGYNNDELKQYVSNNQSDINKELKQNSQWFSKLNLDGTPSFIIQNNTTGKIQVIPGFPRDLPGVIKSLS